VTIRSRWNIANALPGITSPELADDKAAMVRSISVLLRILTGVNSTPSGEAMDWIAPYKPRPAPSRGSRVTAARVKRGAMS
jgi:hypothetical protein